MKLRNTKNIPSALAITLALFLSAGTAHGQSNEGALGGVVGGTLGAIVGGEIDNKGSSTEGILIGAVVGGTLGYVIGDGLNDDKNVRGRYANQPGAYYQHNGKSYRRYKDKEHGYVSILITSNDPYYYSNGRRKSISKTSYRRGQHSLGNRRVGY